MEPFWHLFLDFASRAPQTPQNITFLNEKVRLQITTVTSHESATGTEKEPFQRGAAIRIEDHMVTPICYVEIRGEPVDHSKQRRGQSSSRSAVAHCRCLPPSTQYIPNQCTPGSNAAPRHPTHPHFIPFSIHSIAIFDRPFQANAAQSLCKSKSNIPRPNVHT